MYLNSIEAALAVLNCLNEQEAGSWQARPTTSPKIITATVPAVLADRNARSGNGGNILLRWHLHETILNRIVTDAAPMQARRTQSPRIGNLERLHSIECLRIRNVHPLKSHSLKYRHGRVARK